MPQETILFHDTIFRNITLGHPGLTRENAHKALVAAGLEKFISSLPDGLNTNVGERGNRVSGGERQRLAIARAILHNPSVLLLDEATSALDSENERLVQDAMDRLMADRTTLIIAHRLATVKSADRIAVIDTGKVIAEGTPETVSGLSHSFTGQFLKKILFENTTSSQHFNIVQSSPAA